MQTILVVDDTKTNINIVMELLDNSYDMIACRDGKTAIDMIYEDKPDLILLDIVMPDMDGFEVCRRLKLNKDTKDIPIIFITAKTDERSIEIAYDLGGSDYVTKPFRPKELQARVKRELEVKKLQNELTLLASTDTMTKLYNRRYFTTVSEHIVNLAKRDKKDLCLIMIDIDDFKNINDTYGHKIGDEVIIKFAEILQKEQRKSDISCRFGGEEFVLLLPETEVKNAQIVAEKLRVKTQEIKMIFDSKGILNFTISLGISSVLLKEEVNIEKALQRADEALYKAKRSGKNRICIQ